MVLYEMREKYEMEHGDGDHYNPIQMILMKLGERFPNPDETTVPEVVEFVMSMLKEHADLSQDEMEMIKMRLQSVDNVRDLPMVFMELEAEFGGHHDDHHDGPGDYMGGMTEMFDPERANQEMIAAIPQFVEELKENVRSFVESFQAEGQEIRPRDILNVAENLGEPLMAIGVTPEELDMLRRFLEKNVDNIESPEDFIMGLTHALTMIAYGYPQMMDP
jgi:non-homologous end joining protein Ku